MTGIFLGGHKTTEKGRKTQVRAHPCSKLGMRSYRFPSFPFINTQSGMPLDDSRCMMKVMSQGLSCWREGSKIPVSVGKELAWSPHSVITLSLGFDSLGNQEKTTI